MAVLFMPFNIQMFLFPSVLRHFRQCLLRMNTFSEVTDISRINALAELAAETHLVLQGNVAFSSFVYAPTLPQDEQWFL